MEGVRGAPLAGYGRVRMQVDMALRPYDGKEDICSWVRHAEAVGRFNGWEKRELTQVAEIALAGRAAVWWGTIRDMKEPDWSPSWKEFSDSIKEYFSTESADEVLERIHCTPQGRRKTKEYATDLRADFMRIPDLTPGEKLRIFIKNLRPGLRRNIKFFGATTFEEAVKAVSRIEDDVGIEEDASSSPLAVKVRQLEEQIRRMTVGYRGNANYEPPPRPVRMPEDPRSPDTEAGHVRAQCPKARRRP